MAEIGVIGSINMDLVVQAPRFPKPGETVSGDELNMVPGGKGANQAVAAARMGASVAFCGRVGGDVFGPQLKDKLEDEGIDIEHVKVLPDVATGVALVVLDEHGQNMIVSSHGANDSIRPADLSAVFDEWTSVRQVVLQMELPVDVVAAAIEGARSRGWEVILNAAPADAHARKWFAEVDVLIVNETEAELLSGLEVADAASARSAGKALCASGVRVVILTLGPDGAMLIEGEHVDSVPTPEVEVVDTTGAGDAFVGAYAARRLAGDAHLAAVQYGVCAGALAVTVLGAQPSLPYWEAVEHLNREVFDG
ncbi:MAG: ribokinase [Anaerolineales bacterium]|jgi:ribokinase